MRAIFLYKKNSVSGAYETHVRTSAQHTGAMNYISNVQSEMCKQKMLIRQYNIGETMIRCGNHKVSKEKLWDKKCESR